MRFFQKLCGLALFVSGCTLSLYDGNAHTRFTFENAALEAPFKTAAAEWTSVCGVKFQYGPGDDAVVVKYGDHRPTSPEQIGWSEIDGSGDRTIEIRPDVTDQDVLVRSLKHEIGHMLGIEHQGGIGLMAAHQEGFYNVTPGLCRLIKPVE